MSDDRFPNEDERARRRVLLHQKLDDFLDEGFVEAHKGSGWARATDEQMSALSDIFDEVIALKFSRDGDGDSSIRYALAARHRGRLISEVIPHEPTYEGAREPTQEERLGYLAAMLRVQSYFSGVADDLARRNAIQLQEINRRADEQRTAQERVDALVKRIMTENLPYDEARKLVETYRAGVTKRGAAYPTRPSPERQLAVMRAFRQAYHEVYAKELSEIGSILTEAEQGDEQAYRRARNRIEAATKKFGGIATTVTVERFNRLVSERRQAQKAAGGKPSEPYLSCG